MAAAEPGTSLTACSWPAAPTSRSRPVPRYRSPHADPPTPSPVTRATGRRASLPALRRRALPWTCWTAASSTARPWSPSGPTNLALLEIARPGRLARVPVVAMGGWTGRLRCWVSGGFLVLFVNRSPWERNRDAMDDDGLIVRVAAGDDTALRELFFRHAPWLAARLRVVLPAADVEDVLQETFLAVWKGAGGYRPGGSVGSWVWGIARRQAALFLRRRGPAALLLPVVVAADGRHASPDREVWQLMYVEDRPVAEVAELMGVPEGTVKSRAHRARRLLRAALGGDPAAEGGTR